MNGASWRLGLAWLAGVIMATLWWHPLTRPTRGPTVTTPPAAISDATTPRINAVEIQIQGPSQVSAPVVRAALAPETSPLLGRRLSDVGLLPLYHRLDQQQLLVGGSAYRIHVVALLVGERTDIVVSLNPMNRASGT